MTTPSPDKLVEIPEAAVEAACWAHAPQWGGVDETIKTYARQQMRAALTAARSYIPHIPDRGYAEGIEAAAQVARNHWNGGGVSRIEMEIRALVQPAQANATERLADWFNSLPDGGLGKEDFDRLLAIVATPSPIEDVAGPSEVVEYPFATKPSDAAQDGGDPPLAQHHIENMLAAVNGDPAKRQGHHHELGKHECLVIDKYAARQILTELLAARRVRPSPVDEDALTSLQDEQREFARKASVETDPLLKERWSGISVGMHTVLDALQSRPVDEDARDGVLERLRDGLGRIAEGMTDIRAPHRLSAAKALAKSLLSDVERIFQSQRKG